VTVACLAFATWRAAAQAPERAKPALDDGAVRSFAVDKTFNQQPFSYESGFLASHEGCDVYRLAYPSPVVTTLASNNTVPAEYYLPKGIEPGEPPRPAVVCLHILDGNFELVRMLCSVLAKRGMPAIMFKLPFYGERGPPGGPRALLKDANLFASALSQTVMDVKRTVDVLRSRPEVDPDKVGIAGISLGGILAATAAGEDERLSRAGLILAGGDLLRIAHHARETRSLSAFLRRLPPPERAAAEKTIDSMDPLQHAARLRELAAAGKVLMINAAQDDVIPRSCTQKLADAIGMGDRIVWLEGLGHYTAMAALRQVLDATVAFFAEDLPASVGPAAPDLPESTPFARLANVGQQLCTMITTQPLKGRCHFLDLSVSVKLRNGKKHDGELRFIHGAGGRFRLECRLPSIGAAAFGQSDHPWMAAPGKKVFRGVDNPIAAATPLVYVDPQEVLKVRMLAGLAVGMLSAPAALEPIIEIAKESADNGAPALCVRLKARREDHVRLVFKPDGNTPDRLEFAVKRTSGTVTFRQWQVGTIATAELFEAPRGLEAQDVEQSDVYRTFAALLEFAMEKAQ